MKIYTKTGDKGKTSLFGGKRVLKSDAQINAYGTVDELNSWIGLLRDTSVSEVEKDLFLQIQEILFTIGSHLAVSSEKRSEMKLPALHEEFISVLEREMDTMDAGLPEMKNFVLPGGHVAVSYCHIARTVCRRAERAIVDLNQEEEEIAFSIRYVNRLSDFLFVLSRKWAMDLKADERPWLPTM